MSTVSQINHLSQFKKKKKKAELFDTEKPHGDTRDLCICIHLHKIHIPIKDPQRPTKTRTLCYGEVQATEQQI